MAEEKKAEETTKRVKPTSMSQKDFDAKCKMLDEYDKCSPKDRLKKFKVDPSTHLLEKA